MPKTHVTRRKIIHAPIETVYDAVVNMEKWEAWSPWLMMEPEAKVTTAADKKSYNWTGSRVGEGHMALTDNITNQSARYDLTFLKPFKSHAKVGMDLKPMDGGTEVTWSMDSALPFFMFFMKNMMETFIGMDYERGLNLLKDYAEDGRVHSKLNFIGPQDYPGTDYIGLSRHCTVDDMPSLMGQDFKRLNQWAKDNGLDSQRMFSVYHKFDILKGKCHYTAALPVAATPNHILEGFTLGRQDAAQIYTLEHVGPYHHLGNAWSTLHNMIRGKEIKPIKTYHPFETYMNNPEDTPPNDLVTHINFAVK